MKRNITQNNLSDFYRKEVKSIGKQHLGEILERKRFEKQSDLSKHSIFLSHSHLDKTIVMKMGLLFEKINTELYVDWMDKTLPESTNIETAAQIKTKISECNNFLFLATYHGLRSKWCNWELGIADSLKANQLAILPIESKSGNWKGNEYLQLYPEMVLETDNLEELSINQIGIRKPNGQTISFSEWIGN
ncbi:toll/interleukin-1 receptor domain-containing protein [Carboxylicivirga sediminis]|uniref:Toll/interleukin-1 receptor domain-containing protein n=1 Tax=Carboxylicivirga sediminis TaxID=2006564 RepID=A0A941IYW2_9BACT|nr:toll/interleukin-1 receptor domain-containing protein [Carboxylicivirga sediminis]MBR8537013.1 toll/interleukin-1 receptor domain-containing protein [Carboxylicivirga sediminis]